MKPFAETILYLQGLIIILKKMQSNQLKDKDYANTNVGFLNDIMNNFLVDKLLFFLILPYQ